MGNQQPAIKQSTNQKSQSMGFRNKLLKSINISSPKSKKAKYLKQQSQTAKHFAELPTRVMGVVSQFLSYFEFINLRLCSRNMNEKISKIVIPYINYFMKIIKFEDCFVQEDYNFIYSLVVEKSCQKWRGIGQSIFQIKKQFLLLRTLGYREFDAIIKNSIAKVNLPLPELTCEILEPGLTTWAQKRIIKQKYKLYNQQDSSSFQQLINQLKLINNEEFLNQIIQGKEGIINNYCPTFSIIIHTIIYTIKTFVQAIKLIIEDIPVNCLMQTYVTLWKKYLSAVATMSDPFGTYFTQFIKVLNKPAIIFEIEMFSIWKNEIFNKQSCISQTLMQLFNSKMNEYRTKQNQQFDHLDQLQTFFNSLMDLQIDINNIQKFGHHDFVFSDEILVIFKQIRAQSEILYEKFENTKLIDDDIGKLSLIFPEWIIDCQFQNIAKEYKMRKIAPILESEILEILEDPQINLLEEENDQLKNLSIPEQLEKQQQQNIDCLLIEEINQLIKSNKQIFNDKFKNKMSEADSDDIMMSSVSTVSTFSSSIRSFKSSQIFSRPKIAQQSSDFIVKSLRQKKSKVLIELETEIKGQEKRNIERETRERHILLKQNRQQQILQGAQFTKIQLPIQLNQNLNLAQMINSLSK